MKALTACLASLIFYAAPGTAIARGLPAWNNHAAPRTFLFGNHFDTHQQSEVGRDGDLSGLLYIRFSGVTTADGWAVASHTDCNATSDCTVGWTMAGKLRDAVFLYHAMEDHPVFQIERSQIPQRGAYAHFHRVAPDEHSSGSGYVLQLFAVQRFCFIHHEAEAADPGRTCEENGGVAVTPGLDIATHLNIVSSAPHACEDSH